MDRAEYTKILHKIQQYMMYAISVIFLITAVSSYFVYTESLISHNTNTLMTAIDDTQNALEVSVRDYLLELTNGVAYTDIGESLVCMTHISPATVGDLDGDNVFTAADIDVYLNRYVEALGYSEINVIDESGMIIYSNIPGYYGYDMTADTKSNDQAHDFFEHIEEKGYYVQEYRGTSHNMNKRMRYAGIRLNEDCYLCDAGSYIQVGYNENIIKNEIRFRASTTAAGHHVGDTGKIIICPDSKDGDEYVPVGMTGLSEYGDMIQTEMEGKVFGFDPMLIAPDVMHEGIILGEDTHYMYRQIEGYYIVATIPLVEAHKERETTLTIMIGMELIAFFLIYLIVYLIILHVLTGHEKQQNENKSGSGP